MSYQHGPCEAMVPVTSPNTYTYHQQPPDLHLDLGLDTSVQVASGCVMQHKQHVDN